MMRNICPNKLIKSKGLAKSSHIAEKHYNSPDKAEHTAFGEINLLLAEELWKNIIMYSHSILNHIWFRKN